MRNLYYKTGAHHLLFCRQFLASLQIDPDKLLPQFDTIPDVLVEKCAAISVRPETMKELTGAMDGMTLSSLVIALK